MKMKILILNFQVGRGLLSSLGQLQILNLGFNQIDHVEVKNALFGKKTGTNIS